MLRNFVRILEKIDYYYTKFLIIHLISDSKSNHNNGLVQGYDISSALILEIP